MAGGYFTDGLTLRQGAKVYASDAAYVGYVRDPVTFAPMEELGGSQLAICGSPIIGGDFSLDGALLKAANEWHVDLACDFSAVLCQASRSFQWPERAKQSAETRGHHEATEIIEIVNRQTFALLRTIRSVRQEAVRQFGELSPEEEALIKRITEREIEAIDASVQKALAGIDTTKEVAP